ncbi:gamma-glutamyl-gamma-aminobutyrate hydrolase [Streptomyces sp. WAC 01529]|uniref:gamma-glutamyl-gamma-aminobutyrate hydrolase family protein n=1 Tax=Streptomyces sp. WAC 01529 TaxID=2203205 RepID=UPI000F6DD528|nr:gamma-glutamyl-gamma-aminobutyrate hydrolase family protein [Streptomyces sp. WAC 01529]AZM55256.1 gamma-glutamyl-gamma-aminobutyrate hydrolase [Streptomyces sp. WAC 01529]
MTRPLVALACSAETWDEVPHDAVRHAYVAALEEAAECTVALIPGPGHTFVDQLDRFDAVVLGGHETNVAPERYAATDGPGPFDTDRDTLALAVIPAAVEAGLPLLGICRGLQELNVAHGGTLRAVEGHREDLSLPRDEQYLPAHAIRIHADGTLYELTGRTASARVNSLHGQAIDRLGPGLRIEAQAPDGVIEAVSVADSRAFGLAVQWHPEWYATTDRLSRKIFRAFGDAARKHAAGR